MKKVNCFFRMGLISLFLTLMSFGQGEKKSNPFAPLLTDLKPVIQEYYPKAIFEDGGRETRIKFETMEFFIHRTLRDGSIEKEPQKEEGPTPKGFMIVISNFRNRRYNGSLKIPLTLPKPYWSTFVNEVKRGETYFWVRFSFGGTINRKFKDKLIHLLKN